ncbi:hypothetical protein I5G61_gp16 [Mycobacterium phage Quesadilla]|uniref:Uncharacterized protein n=1 Tax=Mycobacterium phage Quesadilla TaxID=2664226 RepID=A0A5Q2WEG0_9CAUD|nr:hypothetical protein I5G61_gp16 [Mycobacterium phage Quesadilla]QGH75264.1 hypothetical protein SEA_QUESADILLA_16 [Mycobacterium phage Quesadilla]
MPEGILATVDDGFATIDFVDPALRGPALAQLVELGGASSIETITRVGPRRQYRVPEGNAREVGLLDEATGEHARGAVDHSEEDAALDPEGGVRGAFTPGNAGVDTGAAAALKAANPNTNATPANAGDWHTPTAEYTSENKYVGTTSAAEERALAPSPFTGSATSHGGSNAAETPTHREVIDRVKEFKQANPKGAPRGEAAPHAPVQALNTGLKDRDSALADDPGARPDEGGAVRGTTYSTPQSQRAEGAQISQEARGGSRAAEVPGAADSGSQEAAGGTTPPDTEDVVEYPEGEPSDKWRRDELDAYALKVKSLDTSGLGSKAEVLKAIQKGK